MLWDMSPKSPRTKRSGGEEEVGFEVKRWNQLDKSQSRSPFILCNHYLDLGIHRNYIKLHQITIYLFCRESDVKWSDAFMCWIAVLPPPGFAPPGVHLTQDRLQKNFLSVSLCQRGVSLIKH